MVALAEGIGLAGIGRRRHSDCVLPKRLALSLHVCQTNFVVLCGGVLFDYTMCVSHDGNTARFGPMTGWQSACMQCGNVAVSARLASACAVCPLGYVVWTDSSAVPFCILGGSCMWGAGQ